MDKLIENIEKMKKVLFSSHTRIILTSLVCLVFTIAMFMSFTHKQYDLVQFFGGMIASISGVYTAARAVNKNTIFKNKTNEDDKP